MYQPLPEVKKEAIDYIMKRVMKGNKDFKEEAIKSFPNVSKENAYKKFANNIVDNILHVGRAEK